MKKSNLQLHLRDATNTDLELTYRIKSKSIKPYVEKIWNWNEQFQKQTHEKKFTTADTKIIELNRKGVGYLIQKKNLDVILIENLLIEEEFQNLGIGKAVMERIIKEAEFTKKIIRLKVLKINSRAKRFYKRIGFTEICETEFHFEMERKPAN